MILIRPSFEIITPINGEEILKQIELAARTCYKSEDKIEYEDLIDTSVAPFNVTRNYTAKSARKLISKLINHGHFAMLEFGGMITVKFICDRGISHELVRHRLCSFAQESTRYCNYGNNEHITFIIPNWLSINEDTYTINHSEFLHMSDDENDWCRLMLNLEHSYKSFILKGWQPQQARSVLPNSLKTEINVSANIREWREIFKQRTAITAHPQMRELMQPLLDKFKDIIPILFDDINY